MAYSEDGAADATVLYPLPFGRHPNDRVIDLVKLGNKSFPVLIDCLDDGRISNLRFNGNDITKPTNVPVGYICLDILMVIAPGKPVSEAECPYDGLGVCMNYGFYFRPDDYFKCWTGSCKLRPRVGVVQQNWRQEFLRHRLRFRNPYDIGIEEFKEFATPKK